MILINFKIRISNKFFLKCIRPSTTINGKNIKFYITNNLIINKFLLTYIFIFFTFVVVYEINFTKTIILVLNFMLFIVMINSKQMNNQRQKNCRKNIQGHFLLYG